MSRKLGIVALSLALFSWAAVAQTSVSSQTSASASGGASVNAGQSGAQVDSSESAAASQQTTLGSQDEKENYRRDAQKPSSHSEDNDYARRAEKPGNPRDDAYHNKDNDQQAKKDSRGSDPAAANASSALASGTTLNAVLSKPVDAKKAKPGDQVFAKTTGDAKSDGSVLIPKGSKLIGHVTQAQAKSKDQANSSLGVVFDHAVLKDGREVPVHAVIQALAAGQASAAASMAGDDMSGAMGGYGSGSAAGGMGRGGMLGGVGSTLGSAAGGAGNLGNTAGAVVNTSANAAGHAAGNVGGNAVGASGQLASNATGVIGMSGMALSSDASTAAQGSVITSTSRNVRLDSGTQMLLRVTHQ